MTPKEPPRPGAGPNDGIVTVPLRLTCPAPKAHRCRERDETADAARARSFAKGSRPPILEGYLRNGVWHITDGNTTRESLIRIHGGDSDYPVRIDPFEPKNDRQARLRAAQRNMHRSMTTLEMQGAIADARAEGMRTQQEIADFFGVTQQRISEAENHNPFAKKVHNPLVRPSENSTSDLSVAPSPSDGQPVPSVSSIPPKGSMTPVPSLPGEIPSDHPEIPPETGLRADAPETSDEKPGRVSRIGDSLALDGSTGGDGADTTKARNQSFHSTSKVASPVSEPPLLSPPNPLKALQRAVDALRDALSSDWGQASEADTRAARGSLALAGAIMVDFLVALDEPGSWTENGPRAQAQDFRFRQMQKVMVEVSKGETRQGIIIFPRTDRTYDVRYFEGKKALTGRFHERQILMAEARA